MTSRAEPIACPPPDQLVAFLAGELAEPRLLEIETHMDECGECRAVLSNMARGGPPPSLGRYRIDTVLGSGGMGIVYRGFDPQLARPVAIKVVRRAGDDAAGRQRLVREAQALARLSHPNVCHVYDVGTQDDEVWVAMELVDGVGLRQWASEARSEDEIIRALLGAAEGIAAAHAAGLVHRDIKPENVLMTRDSRPIVTDFGLARHEDAIDVNAPTMASDPQLTATGAIAGTPAYLAPEQLLGDPIDARVDQFAFGVMAWELLTNSRPFPIVFAARVEAVRLGLQKPKNLAPHLFTALSRAMAAAPADRYPSMRELIEALRAAPSTTSAVGAVSQESAAPLRKRRSIAPAVAGLAVALAGGLAIAMWKRPAAKEATRTPTAAAVVPQPVPLPVAPTPSPQPEVQPEPAPVEPVAPVVTKTPPPKPAVAKPATRRVETPAPQPQPPSQQLTQTEPTPPVVAPAPAPPPRGRYCRSCQVASADAFCRIPTDFANPGTKSNFGVLDWGTVTKVEDEIGSFRDEELRETVITIRGQRKTYRITADFLDSYINTKVGALLAICPEDQNDLYRLSGGPTDLTRTVITLGAQPKTLPAAKLGAKHVTDLALAATSLRKEFDDRITPQGRYLVRTKVEGIDGPRYRMDRWWLEVPTGLKGEDRLETNQQVWMVVEKGRFEEIDGKKTLVMKAAAILDELFPAP